MFSLFWRKLQTESVKNDETSLSFNLNNKWHIVGTFIPTFHSDKMKHGEKILRNYTQIYEQQVEWESRQVFCSKLMNKLGK